MIDYTLAKKLKDSGFPQNGDGIVLPRMRETGMM